ncbi:MAG TPA: DUF2336 domain-containing protein [Caulobacteraceae bacterium]|jgi:uncharacterized protein (DUF2336 family)
MSASRSILTEADVRALVRGVHESERAEAAYKICRRIEDQPLPPEDRKAAQDILRLMVADAGETVRRALAVTLKASPLLPRDVALQLAADVETIATPVLNFSPAFTDDDLAQIIVSGSGAKQVAVAYRPVLPRVATSALAEHGVEEALRIACANDNADFAEGALQQVLDRFPSSDALRAAMVHRQALPLGVSERLMRLVSGALREHLVEHHGVVEDTAAALTTEALEIATLDLAEEGGRAADAADFAAHLSKSGRLTASLLLRALAQGHMNFFEHGVAELAGVPHARTWLMIHDAGPLGLRAIYERAGLPSRLFPAFRAGVDTYKAVELEGGTHDRDRFREDVIQRFLTQHQGATRDELEYLLERLDQATAAAPQPQASAA